MNITETYLKQIIKEELDNFIKEQISNYGVIDEGAIQDFARKWGLPLAIAGTLMSAPGCAINPHAKTCDIGSVFKQNPKKEMVKLMKKHNMTKFAMDGTVSLGHFSPSREMIKKFPNLKGGVDVTGAGQAAHRKNPTLLQLIVLQQAVGQGSTLNEISPKTKFLPGGFKGIEKMARQAEWALDNLEQKFDDDPPQEIDTIRKFVEGIRKTSSWSLAADVAPHALHQMSPSEYSRQFNRSHTYAFKRNVDETISEEIETEPQPLIRSAIEELVRQAEKGWPVGGVISQLHMALGMIEE